MNALWSYFWPAFAAGLICGAVAGSIGFRSRARRIPAFTIGAVAAILLAALWHGPLGAADRFANRVQHSLQATIAYYEVPQMHAALHRGPLTRDVILSGTADEFQRGELARLVEDIPGVANASWSASGGDSLPLILEGCGAALLGFLFGLLLAYLVELRRRYNAEWNW